MDWVYRERVNQNWTVQKFAIASYSEKWVLMYCFLKGASRFLFWKYRVRIFAIAERDILPLDLVCMSLKGSSASLIVGTVILQQFRTRGKWDTFSRIWLKFRWSCFAWSFRQINIWLQNGPLQGLESGLWLFFNSGTVSFIRIKPNRSIISAVDEEWIFGMVLATSTLDCFITTVSLRG